MNDFFGAPKISYDEISSLEAQSGDLIVYAIPFMAFFTLLEIWYSWYSEKKNYDTKESLGSLFVGLGNVAINLVFKLAFIYGAIYVYNVIPWRMEFNWWTIIPCLLVYDFCSYLAHRVSHFNRFFWGTHVIHHSADHYNLTVSFRLSWVQHFKLFFFLPVALMGFHPVIFFIVNQISVLFQFWQHTEYIGKLHPWIEKVVVTPSNHRVHHGSDEKYIDKNFAAIFIFWDMLLGTYQKEEEKPTYGITHKLEQKVNPLHLNFHEYESMYEDVKNAKTFKEKWFYIFGSPGDIDKVKKAQITQKTVTKEEEILEEVS